MRLSLRVPRAARPGARGEDPATAALQRRVSFACVLGACLFVFWQMRPDLLFVNTTPAGGDMAAHVWGPAYLRDHLLPSGRLTGWSPDWYAGFPAYHFYMVLPSLAIAVASFVMPYGVAFKLVSIVGVVSLPLAAAALVRIAGLRFPGPTLAALFMLPFLFDTSFSIYGGNVASTLAGEFAYSISLSLMLVYLGVVMRGLRTGRHRVLAGVLLALVGLSHLIPAIFAVAATGLAFIMRPRRRNFRWLCVVGTLGASLGAFWLLPFWWWRDYYHNIDWVNLTEYWPKLVRDDWSWVYVLAWAGLLFGILRRQRLAVYLAGLAAAAAAAYRWIPQGVLWNGRILPFYYLSLLLLAAVGVATLLTVVVSGVPFEDKSNQRGSPSTGDSTGWRRWTLSPRQRIAAAAAIPTGAAAATVDGLAADSAALIGLLRILPGVDGDTAHQRAVEVVDLAALILIAAGVVAFAELCRSLRLRRRRRKQRHRAVAAADRATPRREGTGTSTDVDGSGDSRRRVDCPAPQEESVAGSDWVLTLATVALSLIMVLAVAYPLRALGALGHEGADGRYGLRVAPNVVLAAASPDSFIPYWVHWNFSGYEGKEPGPDGGGYEEYARVVDTMAELAAIRGCGRVMWEYGEARLESYGSPMSLMLLPYWTNGCLGSMEGLFFESTHTVPFHFINQAELSAEPSRPVRSVPYGGMDLPAGVAHMQLFGVRYYMAFSEPLIASARAHPDLAPLGTEPPWAIFEVADAPLVAPLAAEPVVVTGADGDGDRWMDVAVPFYSGYVGSGALDPATAPLSSAAVFPAADGPPGWKRVHPGFDRPVRALGATEVYEISSTRDSISFRVTNPGVPVLVKTSYFPNWRAENASGPYRVAPNFMVVVPESGDVTLTYGWTAIEVVAWVITGLGLLMALLLGRGPHIWTRQRPPGRPALENG